eukprot:TRINITY_DN12062_c0_g2_i10.p1 TRINITY_DN12062_c0_g2~~TRINITY_DN12062_c0_g2_i10.p1  ORF type:complete len:164 (+),score=14.38 TRINITY_DN12062_c0_g2_i10:150-641(+)
MEESIFTGKGKSLIHMKSRRNFPECEINKSLDSEHEIMRSQPSTAPKELPLKKPQLIPDIPQISLKKSVSHKELNAVTNKRLLDKEQPIRQNNGKGANGIMKDRSMIIKELKELEKAKEYIRKRILLKDSIVTNAIAKPICLFSTPSKDLLNLVLRCCNCYRV